MCAGDMVFSSGVGPEPIHHKELDVTNLTEAIMYLLRPSAQVAAQRVRERIEAEVSKNSLLPTLSAD